MSSCPTSSEKLGYNHNKGELNNFSSSTVLKEANFYQKPCENLSGCLINLVDSPLKNAKQQLTELNSKQAYLIENLHWKNVAIAEVQYSQELQAMFTKMKLYHSKLQGVKRDIKGLHERSQKLKKRALRLQSIKEKEPREEVIVTKPSKVISSLSSSQTSNK